MSRGPVVLDARAAARPELGGVERWARELRDRLPALRPGGYRVATPPPRLVHRAGHLWEQSALPAGAAALRARWLLCPANLAPLTGPTPLALVLHDVAPLRDPDWYHPLYVRWQRVVLPRLARRAGRLVTVSAFSAGEIEHRLGVDRDRVDVVPGGVDARFRPEAADPAVAERLGLRDPYVLCVASRTARKNLAVLGPVARRLRADGLRVVLVGGDRPQFAAEPADDGTVALGHVADADLPAVYAGASAFVLPSRYEGFGLPCLEAMAAGTPVVTTRAGALPEVCGDAARYADPDDAPGLARELMAAAADDAQRTRGLRRAARFGWGRTAMAVDALLHDGPRPDAASSMTV